jgi:hypothetical protein
LRVAGYIKAPGANRPSALYETVIEKVGDDAE